MRANPKFTSSKMSRIGGGAAFLKLDSFKVNIRTGNLSRAHRRGYFWIKLNRIYSNYKINGTFVHTRIMLLLQQYKFSISHMRIMPTLQLYNFSIMLTEMIPPLLQHNFSILHMGIIPPLQQHNFSIISIDSYGNNAAATIV